MRINDEIRAREVRLVDEDGGQLGLLSINEALDIAREKGLDLVEIAPSAKPPVCKTMDYGKYKYEQSKKEKEVKKKQKTINVKEVKLRLNIEENDFMTKARNAIRFLKDGDKVKVTIMFRGREITHSQLGLELSRKFAETTSEYGKVERAARLEGRNMIMILVPKNE